MKTPEIRKVRIDRFKNGSWQAVDDSVAIEEPLEISLTYWQKEVLQTKNISITMRTPGHDKELACGFLFTEGILSGAEAIEEVQQFLENEVIVIAKKDAVLDLSKIERHFYTSSSCGVCGKSSIDAIRTVKHYARSNEPLKIPGDVLMGLNTKVKAQQEVFESTGGLHASALFDQQGNFLGLFEDVGRHNALDKLIGASLLEAKLPLDRHILFLSGRASFELVQKAAMANIPVICALGAPSSLAVELSLEFGITLAGFLKDQSFNVYSGPERIL